MKPVDLAGLLTEHRDRIVARFVEEVQRKDLSPRDVRRPLLVDHIPKFIDEIVNELQREQEVRFSHDAIDTSKTARQHGQQRWGLGYDLDGLIREYGVLRHCIIQTAKDTGAKLSLDEFDVLAKCLSVGVAEAVGEYARFRDEELSAQKANLEFLAEAGQLLSSSLDYRSTLSRLTGLIVPRLADWCSVHLDGQPDDEIRVAHVDPSKIAALKEIYQRFPLPPDAGCGYAEVARTGKPALVPRVDSHLFETLAQSPEHLALLREINVCSWMVVPLRIEGAMFGAFTLAYSDSKRQYAEQDLVLAVELARRAAIAIDNARLYELSQKERSRVEAATRAKDEFVAMISHELRTPLNAILGWIRLMREENLSDSKREHAFAVIERNANAQDRLVADLLDISKVIRGEVRLSLAEVNFSNIVEVAVEGIRPAAEAKQIQINSHLPNETAALRGDGVRLQQVVWNLLANAVKFTPQHGTMTITLRHVGAVVELLVKDNGEGISERFLPTVFDSFRQSEAGAARRHGGLGIGLSIARHIVELHSGSIEAHSPGLGGGATFVVRLPTIDGTPPSAPGVRAAASDEAISVLTPHPPGQHALRVLVVDDEEDARDLLGELLEGRGMEVRLAGSTAEALAALETFTPHVILSDIGMPGEDGYSLIRRVRSLPSIEKSSVPAIALTAFASNEDRTRALVEGFNLHVSKPAPLDHLVQAVAQLAGAPRER